MNACHLMPSRRGMLHSTLVAGAMAFLPTWAFAEELMRTPPIEEGPFYPHKLPLDTDNDLILINDSLTPAIGQITHLMGRILDSSGSPIGNALVEIWQCDVNGHYIAGKDQRKQDTNFQGYGRFLTSSSGEYYFRTIKPVPYDLRPAAHVHFKIHKGREELLTTQMFIRGFAGNKEDHLYNSIRSEQDRKLASAEFKPIKDSKINELAANFDIVIGRTPEDDGHKH